jgi:hypothetical protein
MQRLGAKYEVEKIVDLEMSIRLRGWAHYNESEH